MKKRLFIKILHLILLITLSHLIILELLIYSSIGQQTYQLHTNLSKMLKFKLI